MTDLTRRHLIAASMAGAVIPLRALAETPREITWDDLIPPGVPYAEIIGEGELDMTNDTWSPIFDANAVKLNEALDGAYIRMPGYVIPLEIGSNGVSEFILVPYVGACIHVPPPPANQLVLVSADPPWPEDDLWAPVWATGYLHTRLQTTELAEIGYTLTADQLELYQW